MSRNMSRDWTTWSLALATLWGQWSVSICLLLFVLAVCADTSEDPDLQNQAAGPSGSSHMQPPLSMPPQHQPSSVDDMFHNETGLEGGSDDDDDGVYHW